MTEFVTESDFKWLDENGKNNLPFLKDIIDDYVDIEIRDMHNKLYTVFVNNFHIGNFRKQNVNKNIGNHLIKLSKKSITC